MIWFMDVEPSSLLPGSFPIEVAWVDMDGKGESYLIRPAERWLRGGRGWSAESQAVHSVSLETLMRDGEPVELVARRATDVMSTRGTMACSDAPDHDGAWMEKLHAEAGLRWTVRLLDVRQVYKFACRPLVEKLAALDLVEEREAGEARVRNLAHEIVAAAEENELRQPRVRHRALADAEGLWRTWREVRAEVTRQATEGGER